MLTLLFEFRQEKFWFRDAEIFSLLVTGYESSYDEITKPIFYPSVNLLLKFLIKIGWSPDNVGLTFSETEIQTGLVDPPHLLSKSLKWNIWFEISKPTKNRKLDIVADLTSFHCSKNHFWFLSPNLCSQIGRCLNQTRTLISGGLWTVKALLPKSYSDSDQKFYFDFRGFTTWSLADGFNLYPWILEKKIQNAGPWPRVFCGKNPERSIKSICICFCAVDFFRKSRSVMVPKNGIYFSSAPHISPHIGICHLKLVS